MTVEMKGLRENEGLFEAGDSTARFRERHRAHRDARATGDAWQGRAAEETGQGRTKTVVCPLRTVDYQALSVKRNAPRWIKMLRQYGYISAPA